MKRNTTPYFLGLLLLTLMGCDGRPSQKDMMRRALRGRNKEQNTIASKAGPKTTKPKDNKAPQTTSKPKSKANSTRVKQMGADTGTPNKKSSVAKATKRSTAQAQKPAARQEPRVVKPFPKKLAKNLTPKQRLEQSTDNMRKIGQAILAFTKHTRLLPSRAIFNKSGSPLLSWRVRLLPYLGYNKLYKEFKLDEPWDGPNNIKLLSRIPTVFQSPSRQDQKTNYLLPVSSGWMFGGRRGIPPRKIEDGVANSIMLIEVDDDQAVEWTKPDDFKLNRSNPKRGLGNLRPDGFLVAWGNGLIRFVHKGIDNRQWLSALSIDGGESITFSSVSQSPSIVSFAKKEPVNVPQVAAKADSKTRGPGYNPVRRNPQGSPILGVGRRNRDRVPVPTDEQLAAARASFRDTYEDEYTKAKTSNAKRVLGKKLLHAATQMKDDMPGMYVTLEFARKVGVSGADFKTANEAADRLIRKFRLSPKAEYEAKFNVVTKVGRLRNRGSEGSIYADALKLIDTAIAEDEYKDAEELQRVLSLMASRMKSRQKKKKANELRKDIALAKAAYVKVRKVFDQMGKPGSDRKKDNLVAGKYYGLLKDKWQVAIPMLQEAGDNNFSVVATWEHQAQVRGHDRMKLANRWWELSRSESEYSKEMKLRAVFWYLTLIPNLPASLEKVKAQHRVDQAKREFGKDVVKKIREKAKPYVQRLRPTR